MARRIGPDREGHTVATTASSGSEIAVMSEGEGECVGFCVASAADTHDSL